jgi:hypothetical protein
MRLLHGRSKFRHLSLADEVNSDFKTKLTSIKSDSE